MGTCAHVSNTQAQLRRLKEWWRVEEVMGGGGRIVLKPNAPARFMLSYLIHFFDFAPFLRARTGTFRASIDPSAGGCGGGGDGGGEEEEDS